MVDLDLEYPSRCPDCGGPVVDSAELAAMPDEIALRLRNRRLAVPDEVYGGLKLLGAQLRCRAGMCCGRKT